MDTDGRWIKRILLLFLIFAFCRPSGAEMVWQEANSGITDADIRSIAVFAKDDRFVCASSPENLYLSQDSGQSWQNIFSLGGQGEQINFVSFSLFNPDVIYLATTEGLFLTKNQGRAWEKIFRKVGKAKNNVNWVAPAPSFEQRLYIGTEEGLYASENSGKTWQRVAGGLPRSQVRSIALHPANSQILYLANNLGLYKSIDAAQSWERVYVTGYRGSDEEGGGNVEGEEEIPAGQGNQGLINCIAIDSQGPKNIFIATGRGVFVSRDAAETWTKLPEQGLTASEINYIVLADETSTLYAAAKGGVFEFSSKKNRWQNIYQGMSAAWAQSLALAGQKGELFAATDKGVFKTVKERLLRRDFVSPRNDENRAEEKKGLEQVLEEISLTEPTIHEVQEAALRYAEVIHPDKIKALRRNARLKALLPDVSVDYDKTINYDSGADAYFVGPYDWGYSFSWDVGDLVFNEQVRLIDSNARLLVQLREDIINEITRLYYERRKVQTELILTAPETAEEKLTRGLRLEELTANIDGLTGGYFSRQLNN